VYRQIQGAYHTVAVTVNVTVTVTVALQHLQQIFGS
jgi:hypothetical protein